MWSAATNKAPGQSQGVQSSMAGQLAHRAAAKAVVGRAMAASGASPQPPSLATASGAGPQVALSTKPASPQHSWKAHVAMAGAQHGVPLGPAEIHGAVDALTQAGHFTPTQGAALKAHNGPLMGQAGAQTMHKVTAAAMQMNPPASQ